MWKTGPDKVLQKFTVIPQLRSTLPELRQKKGKLCWQSQEPNLAKPKQMPQFSSTLRHFFPGHLLTLSLRNKWLIHYLELMAALGPTEPMRMHGINYDTFFQCEGLSYYENFLISFIRSMEYTDQKEALPFGTTFPKWLPHGCLQDGQCHDFGWLKKVKCY